MITSLAYFGVTSPAYREWETFGPEVLGSELVQAGPDGAVRLRFDEAAYRMAIHPGDKNGVAYIGWATAGEAEAGVIAARLQAHGLAVARASGPEAALRQVLGFYWFVDPQGIRHELAWGQMRPRTAFRPGRAMSGFRTGEQGLGHVVLAVPDLEASDRFYRDVLGFRLSDTVIDGPIHAHFYHVNGRHHSLAIARSPSDRAAFLHLMVEANTLEDVGTALDLCEARQVPVTRTLGCHTNDRMISFYLQSPSDFRIEYGWGGLEVGELWEPRYYDRTSTWGHRHQHKELSPFLMIEPVAAPA
ncbi:VOC family protein [Bordetella hinzii]|uniref:VOC family protein n=1 Tax=Bordetella hinzii TaxID=103855 RepID=UPI00045A5E20|nr:VOC family protein [Bordetella hinzii]KCB46477.1 putative 2,3-dihydroxybiphenyl 1,2-dioxygenase [Bordetella hinzii 4161]QDJ37491.1 glyoxalase [Bordetella hinzii]QII86705.1 glyoxalase [Bordetella hinzii]VEH25577.1 2,3-dihydroxybiphenyl 1,2-dioxygenase [Bordetella hinzii]